MKTEVKSNEKTDASDEQKEQASPAITRPWKLEPKLRTQLVIDFSDLIVPGAAVGWIPAGPIAVGVASTISTFITGRQIWNRVQQAAK